MPLFSHRHADQSSARDPSGDRWSSLCIFLLSGAAPRILAVSPPGPPWVSSTLGSPFPPCVGHGRSRQRAPRVFPSRTTLPVQRLAAFVSYILSSFLVCLFVFNGRRVSPVAIISPQLEAGVPPPSVIPLLIIPFPAPLPPFSPPRSSQAFLRVYLFVTRNAPPLVWPRTHPFLLIRLPMPNPLPPHNSPVRYLPQHRWPPVRVQCSGPSARQGSGDCSAGLEKL